MMYNKARGFQLSLCFMRMNSFFGQVIIFCALVGANYRGGCHLTSNFSTLTHYLTLTKFPLTQVAEGTNVLRSCVIVYSSHLLSCHLTDSLQQP